MASHKRPTFDYMGADISEEPGAENMRNWSGSDHFLTALDHLANAEVFAESIVEAHNALQFIADDPEWYTRGPDEWESAAEYKQYHRKEIQNAREMHTVAARLAELHMRAAEYRAEHF